MTSCSRSWTKRRFTPPSAGLPGIEVCPRHGVRSALAFFTRIASWPPNLTQSIMGSNSGRSVVGPDGAASELTCATCQPSRLAKGRHGATWPSRVASFSKPEKERGVGNAPSVSRGQFSNLGAAKKLSECPKTLRCLPRHRVRTILLRPVIFISIRLCARCGSIWCGGE